MSDTERRVWLETYCEDLSGKSDEQIADACKRYRQNGENRFFPTPGALLELMKNPYADPPSANRHNKLFGPDCPCENCRNKVPRDGFFKASPSEYAKAAAEKTEMDAWMRKQMKTPLSVVK